MAHSDSTGGCCILRAREGERASARLNMERGGERCKQYLRAKRRRIFAGKP